MQLRSRMPKSTRTSGKSLESAVSAEVHRLPVRRESKRTRECRARTSVSDHRVARHCNRLLVIAARVSLPVRGDHPICRTRWIRSDKPWHKPEQVRSFVDRNKKYT